MIRRGLAAALVLAVIAGAVLYVNRPYTGYSARVILADAGGLQNGSNVTLNGVTVGRVSGLILNHRDRAVAEVQLGKTAAPLGAGARATVQVDGFFGERELILTRGDYRSAPQRSGYTIPLQNSDVSVRLDDVVNALNPDAQGALRTFLDEQGKALVGRGGDLAATLSELPRSLPSLTQLMSQLSSNQRALGSLVVHSDRVVAQVAAQRSNLGQMINSANGALGVLASRRDQLGQTVRTAPATLRQAQSTLATLQGTAIPLAPAADGLRTTAPSLTTALHQIPQFANAAVPTLGEVARVSPQLQRLADVGTPVVRALVPLTDRLTSYTTQALRPVTTMLADRGGAANTFGVMEGWARSTQGFDASSHIFRFGAEVGTGTFAQLLSMLGVPGLPALNRSGHSRAAHSRAGVAGSRPASAPGGTKSLLPRSQSGLGSTIGQTLGATLGPVHETAAGALRRATAAAGGAASNRANLQSLIGYLLK